MRKSWLIWALALTALMLVVYGCANKYLTSGKIAMRSKNYDKAIHDFNLALQGDSTNAEAHMLLAEAYKEKKEYQPMVRHLNTAERLNSAYKGRADQARDSVWVQLFNAGTKNTKEEKYEDGLKNFQMAIYVKPSRYEAYTNAGYVWQQLGNNDSAYTYYQQAYNLDKTNIRVLESFAAMSFNLKQYDRADSLFAAVVEADPANADAWLRRGLIADQKGEYEKAAEYYNKALEIDKTICEAWFNLGIIYFQKLQKLENAEQAFTHAVETCPQGDINVMINLNVVLISEGKIDQAIENLSAFTQNNPQECVGWDLLSQALLRKGEKEKALEANKKYEECNKK